MFVRYLGFVLLVWFPGVLHAQSVAQACGAPSLNDGYFVPVQVTYSHETNLTYACRNGHKPAVEGWWATSTCQNGRWSHEPQCIDEKACIPPDIPNAKYTETQNSWYNNGNILRIRCNEGYETKDRDATATCINGTWSSVPVCEKSILACGEPPKLPHAVIIQRGYQELFAVDSEVKYECEDGYTDEGADNRKSITCISGNWTEGPTCSKGTRPGAGQGDSAEVGTGERHTTLPTSGTQPAGGGGGTRPGTGHGGASSGSGTQPAGGGGGTRPGTGHGGGTSGIGTQPAGRGRGTEPGTGLGGSAAVGTAGGHSTSAGSGTQHAGGCGGTRPGTGHGGSAGGGHITSAGSGGTWPVGGVRSCGKPPTILNGDFVRIDERLLKYRCSMFYKHVGPERVVCYSDGTWSEIPTCEAAYCSVDTDENPALQSVGVKFIRDGERVMLACEPRDHPWVNHYSVAQCTNTRMTLTKCCSWMKIKTKLC